MADLPFLTTFHADWNAAGITGDTWDPGFNPDAFRPWCDVQFTPVLIGQNSQEVSITAQTPKLTLLLLPVQARLESGVLKAVRQAAPPQETPTAGEWEEQDESIGVPLLAETPALELPAGVHLIYRVQFGPMKIQGGSYTFDDFDFAAPTTATRIHLTTVERINLPPSSGNDLVLRMIPDNVTNTGPGLIQFWSNGIALGTPVTTGGGGGGTGPEDTDELPEGTTNLYYTQARVDARADIRAAAAIAALIGAAPAELDTWLELVAAIQDNDDALEGITTALAGRQPLSARLTAIAELSMTGARMLYTSDGGTTWLAATSTSFGRQMGAAADAAAGRALLVLGALATLNPTGTANGTTFLRGDGTWAVPPAGGGGGSGDMVFANDVIDEDSMASNSATKVPTQQSVKAYVDALSAAITAALGGKAADNAVVHLTGVETIGGIKTFTATVVTRDINVGNNPGDTARIVLFNSDANQGFEFGVNTGGVWSVWDTTHGKGPLKVLPDSGDGALTLGPGTNWMEQPLDMDGNPVGNVADPVNAQDVATRAWVLAQLAIMVDGSPGALDTLNELAAALGDDPNFAATMSAALATKALKTILISAGTGLSGGGDLSANRTLSVVYGTTAGTACQGNDARLSDARVPTAHSHSVGDVTGLQAAIDAVQLLVPNTQTGTTYTLVLADASKVVETNNAAANTVTVPPNSTTSIPVNTVIEVHQYGAGQTTIAAGAGVSIRAPGGRMKLTGQYSSATLRKRGTDEWILSGDLSA